MLQGWRYVRFARRFPGGNPASGASYLETHRTGENRLTAASPGAITLVLERLRLGGEPAALDDLLPLVYDELRALARRQRRRAGTANTETLNTTALVHEVYLKLLGASRVDASGRAHFFALAARAMRQVLSNYARARRTAKRSSGRPMLTLDTGTDLMAGRGEDQTETLIALDDALAELGRRSERQRRVVECRFYGGMSIPETALALGISEATVKREWAVAQAWLYRELKSA
ncbi:MAG TPA: ECF-type sigma factor [Gemmatimonadales bacterium]|nr:ECF-type sigma factor [Gemmatimonadales bacterium]